MHGAALNHVISRSVRDSASMLDASHGHERGSPFRIAPPERPYLEEVGRDPGRLRIAFSTRSPLGTAVAPEAIAAVERTAKLLSDLGHDVQPAEPAIDGVALARDFLMVWFANLAVQVDSARALFDARDRDFELDTIAMQAVGRAKPALDYAESYVRWNEYGWKLAQLFETYDAYMTPALAQSPPLIGALRTPDWAVALLRAALPLGLSRLIPLAARTVEHVAFENLRGVPFVQLANVTGVPAMSVPLATFDNGLPLGIQFLADHGGEGRLFALASQLEQSEPWHARRPTLL
jgi:amidase